MKNKFLELALNEAKLAYNKDEVPVGAVVVHNGEVIASAHNLRETSNSATAHAEILAIEKACRVLGNWKLTDCDLYVTLEPCIMCAGAIINARIRSLYFGAYDPKAGACGSVTDVFRLNELNHKVTVYAGIMEDECSEILERFFKEKRK
ncbi:MAG: nucleoside deaminase [Clostridiaceae bacterium]|nr:nucleoside deaminase [Clostridiaceae bacterium]